MAYNGVNSYGYHEYQYTRTKLTVGYDIPNVDRVDGGGFQILLAHEIETALPSEKFCTHCFNTITYIWVHDAQLSSGDETILDAVVSDHINDL